MTYDKQALIELRDAVVGAVAADYYILSASVFPPDSAYGSCSFHLVPQAYSGSLDAALSLLGEVLPGWVIHQMQWKWGDLVEAHLFEVSPEKWHEEGMSKAVGRCNTPSRALLIAILNALIEGCE